MERNTLMSKQGEDFSFQADVGVNPETTTSQVIARQVFAKLPMTRVFASVKGVVLRFPFYLFMIKNCSSRKSW